MSKLQRSALIFVVSTAALVLSGCDDRPKGSWKVCSDDLGRRISDTDCGAGGSLSHLGTWVYYNGSRTVPGVGETLDGASKTLDGGRSYDSAPEGGISRGGFGGTGEGHGGGGGEGGGGE